MLYNFYRIKDSCSSRYLFPTHFTSIHLRSSKRWTATRSCIAPLRTHTATVAHAKPAVSARERPCASPVINSNIYFSMDDERLRYITQETPQRPRTHCAHRSPSANPVSLLYPPPYSHLHMNVYTKGTTQTCPRARRSASARTTHLRTHVWSHLNAFRALALTFELEHEFETRATTHMHQVRMPISKRSAPPNSPPTIPRLHQPSPLRISRSE